MIKLSEFITKYYDKQFRKEEGMTNRYSNLKYKIDGGDELEENYSKLENLQDNDYLENIKSIKHMETDNYIRLLEFIDSGIYQIIILGHSCGNSDRTLLKNNKKLITKDILSDLEIGLSYLLAEIAIEQDDSDEQVSEKILTQQKTSKLLVSLKKYYIEDLKIDLPQYILDWEKICLDINEFSEIRNIWLNDQTD